MVLILVMFWILLNKKFNSYEKHMENENANVNENINKNNKGEAI